MDISNIKFDKMLPPHPTRGPIIDTRVTTGDDGGLVKRSVVQLSGPIQGDTELVEVFQLLYTATPKDEIEIVIDTPGGCVFATQLLTDAMDRCQGKVITNGAGMVASAGTVIFDHGHEKIVGEFAKFMFHGTSHSTGGNSQRVLNEAQFMVDFFSQVIGGMKDRGLITEDEYKRIYEQKDDVYVSAAQMKERLSKLETKPVEEHDNLEGSVESWTATGDPEQEPIEPQEPVTPPVEEPKQVPEPEQDGTPPDEEYYTEEDEFDDPNRLQFDAE